MANPAGKKLIMNIMKEAMAGKKGMIDSESMMNNDAMMGLKKVAALARAGTKAKIR